MILVVVDDYSTLPQCLYEGGGEIMTPNRGSTFLFGLLLVVNLMVGVTFWSGCGSNGPGTIHIESSKARRQMMQTGAGLSPTAAKPSPSAAARKPISRSTFKGGVLKKR